MRQASKFCNPSYLRLTDPHIRIAPRFLFLSFRLFILDSLTAIVTTSVCRRMRVESTSLTIDDKSLAKLCVRMEPLVSEHCPQYMSCLVSRLESSRGWILT